MIPGGTFTSSAITNTFRIPNDMPYTPLSQTVWGGVSVGDSSGGRLVKYWVISYDSNVISVKPIDGPIAFTLPVVDVTSLSLAFDNNMGLAIAYTKADGAYFYYFDSLTSKYITRFFAGANSCRVCVDDARSFYTSNSDVFLVYTLNDKLYYRKQRDRYDVETYVADTTSRLLKVGQNIDNRFQIELGADRSGPPPTPIPQPRLVSIEATLFPLVAPEIISLLGVQPDLVTPIIKSIYGDIYPMPVPVIVDIAGTDVSLNTPTITFLSGSIYSQTAPVIDSFESVLALVRPTIVSVEGTFTQTNLTGYVGSVLAKNPYLYYRLDETTGTVVTDFSGNNRNAVYTEDASLFTTSGLLINDNDKAMATVGIAGKHGVTYNSDMSVLGNTSWSVETVLDVKGPGRVGSSTVFQGGGIPSVNSRFPELAALFFTPDSFKLYLGYTGISKIFVTDESFAIGATYHIVLRYNANTGLTELLVNSVIKASAATQYTNSPGPLNIAFAEFEANDYYNSNITVDEFAIYSVSLTDAQVQRDFNLSIQSKPAIVSIEGTEVSLTAPVLVDFTGTPIVPGTPQLNSFEGTPVAAATLKPSGNDIIFSNPPPSNSDILFDTTTS